MSTVPSDADRWKAGQRQEWDTVAAGWRAWWPTFERSLQVLNDYLIALAHIEAGQRVLDIATGIGEPAVTAARRVGPGGQVVAVDQSPQMLAIARERAAALGLRNMHMLELDAEQLHLLDAPFDAALCRWGLMYLPDLASALQGLRRLLRPGGRAAAAVWAAPARVPMLSLPREVISQYIELPAPPPGTPGPFSLSDADGLEQAFTQAGFSEVRSESQRLMLELGSAADYVEFMRAISPFNALLSSQSTKEQEFLWQSVEETVHKRYSRADGTVGLPGETICLVALR
jgi:enediyne biosynthesis protein CalE5